MPETIRTAREIFEFYMSQDIPTFISGPPGVGKSDMIGQVAKAHKATLIDLRLGTMDPVDLLGLQCIIEGRTVHNKPEWWPDTKRDGNKIILLCDELSDCPRAMQSAAYQLILNRRVGPHILPEGTYPCAAGNRRIDKAAAQAISTALANRFGHIEVAEDAEVFHEWGNLNGISSLVLGFLKVRPALLFSMEGADLRAFPTPRSWAMASKCVDVKDANLRMRLMQGLIGQGAAIEFEGFMKVLDLPDLEDILADPKHCHIPDKPANKYALASMLSRSITRKNIGNVMPYIGRDAFGRDFETVTLIDAIKRDGTLCDCKEWIQWASRNGDIQI